MTENEALEELKTFPINCLDFKENQALHVATKALEEIQQYRAIGTIEEFKALKEKKNVLPIATIKFSKEDMQKIVAEKVAQIELDIQEIRAKAIDEFAEKLKDSLANNYRHLLERDTDGFDWLTTDAVETHIDEIVEQMKAGE